MANELIYRENIAELISQKYLRIDQLSYPMKEMITNQLWWVQESNQYTPQADVTYNSKSKWTEHLHREVFRALSRIECMLLLRDVTEENKQALYAEFIADQKEEDRLSLLSFSKLAEFFKKFTDEQVDAHIRASTIASVTLSPEAKRQVVGAFNFDNYPVDSVLFSGFTVEKCPAMYPVYDNASQNVQKKLQACFPNDNSHWRHAFFLENATCLDAFKAKIANSPEVDRAKLIQELQEWLNYWLINTLGFNGHIKNFRGSEFMTESVFKRAWALNDAILGLFNSPEQDVFQAYVEYCTSTLNLKIENSALSFFVIRLLNMANILNEQNAKNLYDHICQSSLIQIANYHQKVFNSGKIATYAPGLLQNVYMMAKDDWSLLIKAAHWMNQVIDNSNASITSFRLIDKEMIKTLINNDFTNEPNINFENGEVSLADPMMIMKLASPMT